MSDPRDISRFLQHYAKRYHAGAFATPTAKEIAKMPRYDVADIRSESGDRTVLIMKNLTRDSSRRDFVGNKMIIPAGSKLVTNIARTSGAPIPNLDAFDFVYAYVEDRELSRGLMAQGREVTSTNITASSEIVACWGREGNGSMYHPADIVTVGRVPVAIPDSLRSQIVSEIQPLTGWDDDYPYYSDGSWSALSLRGFYKDDPTRGVKPSEMPRAWKASNPADLDLECDWTTLADSCPSIVSLIESVPWWSNLERVRLLRMEGRGGKGGALKRHTDITDRAAGTRDGQIARFHIALQTHPDIKMTAWSLEGRPTSIHLAPWDCWYLDQRKPHAVLNPTGVDRVHLVIDIKADEAVRKQIALADQTHLKR
jgi:hypothetical protein